MRKLINVVFSYALLLTTFESSAFAQGCAMCRAALESSAEGRLVARSFAHGILMMLVLPYLLLGIFGLVLYRAYRKKAKQREDPSYQT